MSEGLELVVGGEGKSSEGNQGLQREWRLYQMLNSTLESTQPLICIYGELEHLNA